jgi:hypothetical protein
VTPRRASLAGSWPLGRSCAWRPFHGAGPAVALPAASAVGCVWHSDQGMAPASRISKMARRRSCTTGLARSASRSRIETGFAPALWVNYLVGVACCGRRHPGMRSRHRLLWSAGTHTLRSLAAHPTCCCSRISQASAGRPQDSVLSKGVDVPAGRHVQGLGLDFALSFRAPEKFARDCRGCG